MSKGKRSRDPEKASHLKVLGRAMRMELREHRSSFLVYLIFRLLVIGLFIYQLVTGNYENAFLCLLTLLLLLIPSFVQVTFKIELPTTLEIIILCFIFAAEILGEINEFYIAPHINDRSPAPTARRGSRWWGGRLRGLRRCGAGRLRRRGGP